MDLFGLGETPHDAAAKLVDGFLAQNPSPSDGELRAFLGLLSGEERDVAAQLLVSRGVSPTIVVAAQAAVAGATRAQWKNWLTIAAAAGAGFHGYRRNNSLGWGLVWFTMGTLFPIVTTVVGLAQGYGQPRKA